MHFRVLTSLVSSCPTYFFSVVLTFHNFQMYFVFKMSCILVNSCPAHLIFKKYSLLYFFCNNTYILRFLLHGLLVALPIYFSALLTLHIFLKKLTEHFRILTSLVTGCPAHLLFNKTNFSNLSKKFFAF